MLLADFWIFLNIILALLISIPAINLFTHGTHITVAYSMGTTIGINTLILLSSVTFILEQRNVLSVRETQKITRSEEHTSELQSRPHLVCRLLLEKKK